LIFFKKLVKKDYSASEWGLQVFNIGTAFIDLFAFLGLAYDLKSVSHEIIHQRIKRNNKFENHLMPNAINEWSLGMIINTSPLWLAFVIRKFSYYYLLFTNNPKSILFL
jgi:hypothetical protein